MWPDCCTPGTASPCEFFMARRRRRRVPHALACVSELAHRSLSCLATAAAWPCHNSVRGGACAWAADDARRAIGGATLAWTFGLVDGGRRRVASRAPGCSLSRCCGEALRERRSTPGSGVADGHGPFGGPLDEKTCDGQEETVEYAGEGRAVGCRSGGGWAERARVGGAAGGAGGCAARGGQT